MKLLFTMANGNPNATLIDGETKTSLPVTMCKDGLTLEVPENPTNRRWLKLATLQEKGEVVLEAREKRVLGSYNRSDSTKKSWTEYLTDEERKLYDELKATAEARKAEAEKPKPKTELEKAQEALRKAQEKLEKLMKEGKAE